MNYELWLNSFRMNWAQMRLKAKRMKWEENKLKSGRMKWEKRRMMEQEQRRLKLKSVIHQGR